MKLQVVIIPLLLLLFSSIAQPDDVKIEGSLETRIAGYTQKQAGAEDGYADVRFLPKITFTPSDKFLFYVEPEFILGTKGFVRPELDVVENSDRKPVIGLREAYGEYNHGMVRARIGNQLFGSWSATDTVTPMNNLNPRDLTDIIWRRDLAVPAVDLKIGGDTFLEAVVVPRFTPSKLPLTGTRWERDLGGLQLADQELRDRGDAQYALRAGTITQGVSLSASYYKGYFSSYKLAGYVLTPNYRPEEVYAVSAAKGMGGFNARVEAGYFNQDGDDKFIQYVVGADRQWTELFRSSDSLFVLAQYCGEEVTRANNPTGLDTIDFRRIFKNSVMAKTEYAPDENGPWRLRLETSYGLSEHGLYLQPSIGWRQDKYEVKTGVDLFAGPKESFFGGYRGNNRLFAVVTWNF